MECPVTITIMSCNRMSHKLHRFTEFHNNMRQNMRWIQYLCLVEIKLKFDQPCLILWNLISYHYKADGKPPPNILTACIHSDQRSGTLWTVLLLYINGKSIWMKGQRSDMHIGNYLNCKDLVFHVGSYSEISTIPRIRGSEIQMVCSSNGKHNLCHK